MNRYVIETKQITKTYNPRSPFIALDHVDLHVSEGCIYGLIGVMAREKAHYSNYLPDTSFQQTENYAFLAKQKKKHFAIYAKISAA